MKKFLILIIGLFAVSIYADLCPKYNIGNELPAYIKSEGLMVPVCPANFSKLNILVRVNAVPDTGKIITKSHGVIQNGQWVEIIDEQKTQAEIDAANPVLALQVALTAEIDRLNAAYPGLNLIAVDIKNQDGTITKADTIIAAIPKLFQAGVTKADSNYLFTLYSAIKEAKTTNK